jgi:hypothetical protein
MSGISVNDGRIRVGPYRFFFYSSDGSEPRHVHGTTNDALAKLWLDPVRVEHGVGFFGD